MQRGESAARGVGRVGGGGIAVPQGLREGLGEQRAAGASEGDERGVRAGGGVGGEGEVLRDVPARQLEQVRHVVRGVADRIVREEVDVTAPHEVELYGESLRAELRLGQPRDDLGEQERQAVRVALDSDAQAARCVADEVIQPGDLRVQCM